MSRGSLLERLTWMFKLYDIQRRNFITRESMGIIFEAVALMLSDCATKASGHVVLNHTERVKMIFESMDVNGDGRITFEEFCVWCRGVSR